MKNWLTPLILSLNLSLFAEYQSIPDKTSLPILTPTLKEQKTAKIRLNNGLEAIIISNPQLQQSAVNLVVKAGSYQDPEEHPGLAHFLEHMLFLGTDEYPVEMDFARFLSEHAGDMNAYTMPDYTSYQFSIPPSGLPEALQRFSSFFKNPLLSKSGVTRELNAIDQEFAKGFNSEGKIAYQVLKHLFDPAHPGYRFNAGNSISLAKATPDDLRQWFLTHYSPERMRLYILSPLPLDTLTKLVDANFSTIPVRKTEPLRMPEKIIADQKLGSEILIGLAKNLYEIDLVWAIPSSMPLDLDNEPEDLLAYLFSNQGEGSVFALLKEEGLVEDISSDSMILTPESRLFEINVSVTEKGFQQKDRVIEALFNMIHLVQTEGYPKSLYEELALLKKQRYQFQEHESPFDWARKQGEWLARESIDTYPERSQTLGSFNPDSIQAFARLLTPEKALYILFAPSQTIKVPLEEKEPWMNVAYSVSKISPEKLQVWGTHKPNLALFLNARNPWIATNTARSPVKSTRDSYPLLPKPITITDQPGARVFFVNDTLYELPRTFIRYQFQSPIIQSGKPKKAVLADLYARLIEQKLFGMFYQAKTADATIKVEQTPGALQLSLEGFTDSIIKLYPALLKEFASIEFDEDDFQQVKERQEREYQNNLLEMPLKQSFDYMKGALIEGYVTYPQKKQALQNVTLNDLRAFQKQFFQKTYIQGMITGSITEEQSKELTDLTVRRLQQGSAAQAKPYFPTVRSLQNCNGPCMVSFTTHAQGNALLLVLGAEGYSAEQRNLQQILSLSTWEAFFTELRTKQQTGYMVASDAVDLYNNLFSYFSVQSSKYLPEELLWRFERFLESYVTDLEEQEVTQERFKSLKAGLKTKLIEPPGSFSLFGELLFKLGFEVKDFNWLNQRITNLDQITYEQFILFAKQFLGRENHRRLALMILDKNAKATFNYTTIDSLNALRKTPLVVDKQKKAYGKQKSL